MFKRIQARLEITNSSINAISQTAIDKPEQFLTAIRNAGL